MTRAIKSGLMTLGLLSSAGLAAAAPKISSQSIIVNPVASPLKVSVWTAKDTSGDKVPGYVPGEHITLNVKTTQDAYVYLFNVDPKGQIDLILPNRFASGASFIKANTTKAFPSKEDKFTFDIAGAPGVNKVLALASKTELDLKDIARFKEDQQTGFATVTVQGGQAGLAQALSIIVQPLPSQNWVTDVAQYQISTRVAALPQPVTSAKAWKASFRSTLTLDRVYTFYANQLRGEGYEERQQVTKPQEMQGKFRLSGGREAELTLKRRGNSGSYDVMIKFD